MANVIIDKSKIDILANAISCKSGEAVTMTLDEMVSAVDGIETGGGTPTLETITKTYTPSTSAVTDTITPSSGYDGIEEVDVTVSAMPIGARGIPSWTKGKSSTLYTLIATFPNVTAGYISSIPAISTTLSLENKVVEPTENQQTVEPTDIGCYLNGVTVNAIPSNYVGSGITQRSSSDLTASGATVTVPSGYYSAQASKAVASGSATPASTISATGASVSTGTNTLTLSKSVSNTPQVSAGYISSGTAGDSSVSLTATVTTNPTPTASGATVTIPAGYYTSQTTKSVSSGTAGTPTASKGTVSNHSISVTPSVTNTTGYITGSTKTGTAVTVSASELVSGSETKTANGTYDVTNLASFVVNIPFVTYYTGTTTPSSSLGSNGDIYLKVVS